MGDSKIMKTTIIICTKNRPKLLIERSLPSVLKQTFPRTIKGNLRTGIHQWAVNIIDSSTNDETYQELKKDYRGIYYYRMPEPNNLTMARNKGVELAQSEYIVFLDDDNEFYSNYLEETIEFLDKHSEYDAVGIGKDVILPEGKVYQSPPEGDYFSMNDGFLMKRKAFLDVKCDEILMANEDADFGLRFLKKYKVGRIDKPLMKVYASAIFNRTSYSDYSDSHLEGLMRFWLKNQNEFDEINKRYYQKMVGRYFLLAAGRPKWFKPMYWLEEKIKRYLRIYDSCKNSIKASIGRWRD